MKKILARLSAALLLAGAALTATALPAAATIPTYHYTVAANNICNAPDGSQGHWDQDHTYVYRLHPENITLAPAWCINANGGRLVLQNNGALMLFNREHMGGSLIWKSSNYNHGADTFTFDRLTGAMIMRYGGYTLWSSGAWGAYCDAAGQFYRYYANVYNNRWTSSQHADYDCQDHSGGRTFTRTFQ